MTKRDVLAGRATRAPVVSATGGRQGGAGDRETGRGGRARSDRSRDQGAERSGGPEPDRNAPATSCRSGRRDAGSATVLVLAGVAVLCLVAGVVVPVGTVALAREQAATAADLAALAGAHAALDGGQACAEAARVAHANRGDLASCDVAELVVAVRVAVRLRGPLARWGPLVARARAGPPERPP
ncbi:MAG TPA: Rv3654c family TadE-like protein [Frankiaceae bacterium]|nr:Rv3654c family TadE-like protein [Frankiaceae bacterium]